MATTESFTLHMCHHTVQCVKKVMWHKTPQKKDIHYIL